MNILKFFESTEKREKLSHIKSLIVLAMADGIVQESELAAIAAVAARENISEKDLQRCIENPKSIDFLPPSDNKTKLNYLRDMVLLMMSDGDIDKKEMLVCKMTAEALGYRHEVIEALILDIIADLKSEMNF